jgi:hypothetical protein
MNHRERWRHRPGRFALAIRFVVAAICCSPAAAAPAIVESPESSPIELALLARPPADGPIPVRASFQLLSISQIRDEVEEVDKVDLDERRLPFDRQHLGLVFRVFGFDASEVVFHADPNATSTDDFITRLPQWTVEGVSASTRTVDLADADSSDAASAFLGTMQVKRRPMFILRLVVFPMSAIASTADVAGSSRWSTSASTRSPSW